MSGTIAALAVILAGLAFFAVFSLRGQRAITVAGYAPVETIEDAINQLAESLFEGAPSEVYRKEQPGGQSWLVFVEAGGSDDRRCIMLVYPLPGDNGPALVAVRSQRRIPKVFRDLTGGIFRWTEPVPDAEMNGLAGTGWYAYREPEKEVSSDLMARISDAAKAPGSAGLLGIALIGSHLAVWSDVARLKTVLATAPTVQAAIMEPTRRA